jgi:prepilin-type N-terminal cleavage/methylation domain-containing protein
VFKQKLFKAFTLVELLIVIAVMGVLAGAVLVSINPADKLNLANDSKVQSDLSQISTALSSYYAQNGYYPGPNTAAVTTALTTAELPVWPAAPTGYTYTVASTPGTCTTAAKDCVSVIVSATLKAVKWGTSNVWKWTSANGKTCADTAATGNCP